MSRSRTKMGPRANHLICGLGCTAIIGGALGAELPGATQLPPPATRTIEFDREVRPILEQSCLRCHGSERPKAGFRLDSRDSALKGGNNNADDVVPGDSAKSWLIHYVARQVEDMEMPPEGKGDPLTAEQVSLLRAWIDQGATWGAAVAYPQSASSASIQSRWLDVHGDQSKFRELEGLNQGWGGGLEYFSLEQRDAPDERFFAEGHFLWPENDFQLKLSWTKRDVMFVRAGFERWRRYFDDTGGYYRPFPEPSFDLDRVLHLDIGRAWVEFGLTRPGLPQAVLGYELQFRDGAKSMLEWGNVSGKNIFPAFKAIDERAHILKLDVTHDLYGWHVENNARVEFYRNRTTDNQSAFYTAGPAPDALVRTRQELNHVQGANTLRVEKQLTDWWTASSGYFYSRFDGDSSVNQVTVNPADQPVAGRFWNSDQITLRREVHAFSLTSLLLPMNALSLSLGAQNQFSRQEGFGNISLDSGDPNVPALFVLQPASVRSDIDQVKTSENATLRYTGIPFTVVFADARLDQDRMGQFERETGNSSDVFLRDTDYANNLQDYRAGFSTSPWGWMALNAHYRWRDSDAGFDHLRDESPVAGSGYSAFIRSRRTTTDEVQAKLVFHPRSWLKASLTYRWTEADYRVGTDSVSDPGLGIVAPGGQLASGQSSAHVYGVDIALAPAARLYFTGAFSWSQNRVATAHNHVPSVTPYEGETCSVMTTANYAWNQRTSLQGAYSFSQAGFGQNNVADGLPLGIDYSLHYLAAGVSRRLSDHVRVNLRYSFYRYAEPSTGGRNDFTGHGVFAVVNVAWR